MLIQPDKRALGDLRLNPTENLAKIKEENLKAFGAKKIQNQETLEDKLAAMGSAMGYQELVRRVKKLNSSIIIRDGGYPNAIAVYAEVYDEGEQKVALSYVTGFMKEVLPEFSSVDTDEHGLPTKEHRGWRTVLLALIKRGLLNFTDVKRVFGDAVGQRAVLWNEQLHSKELK